MATDYNQILQMLMGHPQGAQLLQQLQSRQQPLYTGHMPQPPMQGQGRQPMSVAAPGVFNPYVTETSAYDWATGQNFQVPQGFALQRDDQGKPFLVNKQTSEIQMLNTTPNPNGGYGIPDLPLFQGSLADLSRLNAFGSQPAQSVQQAPPVQTPPASTSTSGSSPNQTVIGPAPDPFNPGHGPAFDPPFDPNWPFPPVWEPGMGDPGWLGGLDPQWWMFPGMFGGGGNGGGPPGTTPPTNPNAGGGGPGQNTQPNNPLNNLPPGGVTGLAHQIFDFFGDQGSNSPEQFAKSLNFLGDIGTQGSVRLLNALEPNISRQLGLFGTDAFLPNNINSYLAGLNNIITPENQGGLQSQLLGLQNQLLGGSPQTAMGSRLAVQNQLSQNPAYQAFANQVNPNLASQNQARDLNMANLGYLASQGVPGQSQFLNQIAQQLGIGNAAQNLNMANIGHLAQAGVPGQSQFLNQIGRQLGIGNQSQDLSMANLGHLAQAGVPGQQQMLNRIGQQFGIGDQAQNLSMQNLGHLAQAGVPGQNQFLGGVGNQLNQQNRLTNPLTAGLEANLTHGLPGQQQLANQFIPGQQQFGTQQQNLGAGTANAIAQGGVPGTQNMTAAMGGLFNPPKLQGPQNVTAPTAQGAAGAQNPAFFQDLIGRAFGAGQNLQTPTAQAAQFQGPQPVATPGLQNPLEQTLRTQLTTGGLTPQLAQSFRETIFEPGQEQLFGQLNTLVGGKGFLGAGLPAELQRRSERDFQNQLLQMGFQGQQNALAQGQSLAGQQFGQGLQNQNLLQQAGQQQAGLQQQANLANQQAQLQTQGLGVQSGLQGLGLLPGLASTDISRQLQNAQMGQQNQQFNAGNQLQASLANQQAQQRFGEFSPQFGLQSQGLGAQFQNQLAGQGLQAAGLQNQFGQQGLQNFLQGFQALPNAVSSQQQLAMQMAGQFGNEARANQGQVTNQVMDLNRLLQQQQQIANQSALAGQGQATNQVFDLNRLLQNQQQMANQQALMGQGQVTNQVFDLNRLLQSAQQLASNQALQGQGQITNQVLDVNRLLQNQQQLGGSQALSFQQQPFNQQLQTAQLLGQLGGQDFGQMLNLLTNMTGREQYLGNFAQTNIGMGADYTQNYMNQILGLIGAGLNPAYAQASQNSQGMGQFLAQLGQYLNSGG